MDEHQEIFLGGWKMNEQVGNLGENEILTIEIQLKTKITVYVQYISSTKCNGVWCWIPKHEDWRI